MDQYNPIPGNERLHESTKSKGHGSEPNLLVRLDPGLFIWTIITFLLLCYVLTKFAWKPLLQVLESRENDIRKSLDDAEKAKIELDRLSDESEKIISEAKSNAQEIRNEAKAAAEKIKSDLKVKTEQELETLKNEAEAQIQVEKDKAISEIRQEVVTLTISVAEKVIGKNLSRDDHLEFIERSIQDLREYEA